MHAGLYKVAFELHFPRGPPVAEALVWRVKDLWPAPGRGAPPARRRERAARRLAFASLRPDPPAAWGQNAHCCPRIPDSAPPDVPRRGLAPEGL